MPLPWQIQLQLPNINLLSDSFTPSLNSHMFSPIIHLDSEQKARVFYICCQTLSRSMDSKPFLEGWSEHSHRGTALTSWLSCATMGMLWHPSSPPQFQMARPAWRKSSWSENSHCFLSNTNNNNNNRTPHYWSSPKISSLILPVFQVRKLRQVEVTYSRPSDRKHLPNRVAEELAECSSLTYPDLLRPKVLGVEPIHTKD